MGRGQGVRMTDHFPVEARLKVMRSAGKMESVKNKLKVSVLNMSVKELEYQASLRGKWEVLVGGDVKKS